MTETFNPATPQGASTEGADISYPAQLPWPNGIVMPTEERIKLFHDTYPRLGFYFLSAEGFDRAKGICDEHKDVVQLKFYASVDGKDQILTFDEFMLLWDTNKAFRENPINKTILADFVKIVENKQNIAYSQFGALPPEDKCPAHPERVLLTVTVDNDKTFKFETSVDPKNGKPINKVKGVEQLDSSRGKLNYSVWSVWPSFEYPAAIKATCKRLLGRDIVEGLDYTIVEEPDRDKTVKRFKLNEDLLLQAAQTFKTTIEAGIHAMNGSYVISYPKAFISGLSEDNRKQIFDIITDSIIKIKENNKGREIVVTNMFALSKEQKSKLIEAGIVENNGIVETNPDLLKTHAPISVQCVANPNAPTGNGGMTSSVSSAEEISALFTPDVPVLASFANKNIMVPYLIAKEELTKEATEAKLTKEAAEAIFNSFELVLRDKDYNLMTTQNEVDNFIVSVYENYKKNLKSVFTSKEEEEEVLEKDKEKAKAEFIEQKAKALKLDPKTLTEEQKDEILRTNSEDFDKAIKTAEKNFPLKKKLCAFYKALTGQGKAFATLKGWQLKNIEADVLFLEDCVKSIQEKREKPSTFAGREL